jgi:hypothetical protein
LNGSRAAASNTCSWNEVIFAVNSKKWLRPDVLVMFALDAERQDRLQGRTDTQIALAGEPVTA